MRILGLTLLLLTATVSAAQPPSAVQQLLATPTRENFVTLLMLCFENRAQIDDWVALRGLLQAPDCELVLPDDLGGMVTTHEIALYCAEIATPYKFPSPCEIRFICCFKTPESPDFKRFHIPSAENISPESKAEAYTLLSGKLMAATLQKIYIGIRGRYEH